MYTKVIFCQSMLQHSTSRPTYKTKLCINQAGRTENQGVAPALMVVVVVVMVMVIVVGGGCSGWGFWWGWGQEWLPPLWCGSKVLHHKCVFRMLRMKQGIQKYPQSPEITLICSPSSSRPFGSCCRCSLSLNLISPCGSVPWLKICPFSKGKCRKTENQHISGKIHTWFVQILADFHKYLRFLCREISGQI